MMESYARCRARDRKQQISDNFILSKALTLNLSTMFNESYDGDIITLECLDNMHKFDVNYSKSNLTYPATLLQIVQDACRCCGVTLATDSLQFEYYNYVMRVTCGLPLPLMEKVK